MNVEFVSLNCVHILYEYFEDFSICSAGSQQKLILHHLFVFLSSSFESLVRRELKAEDRFFTQINVLYRGAEFFLLFSLNHYMFPP